MLGSRENGRADYYVVSVLLAVHEFHRGARVRERFRLVLVLGPSFGPAT